MRTAETIVKEYLERGYGVESLRVLAESRPEPLCSQMLTIIDSLREQEPLDVACEPGSVNEDGMVFFVAADEESASGEDSIDFDLMAATADEASHAREGRAMTEESVAEVLVGADEEADATGESEDAAVAEIAGDEVWSRRWNSSEKKPLHIEVVEDATADEVVVSSADADGLLAGIKNIEEQEPAVVDEIASSEPVSDLNDTNETPSLSAEASCDYLPESVASYFEDAETEQETVDAGEERQIVDAECGQQEECIEQVDGAAHPEVAPQPAAEQKCNEEPELIAQNASAKAQEEKQDEAVSELGVRGIINPLSVLLEVAGDLGEETLAKGNRKERRRRERAEKKKKKSGSVRKNNKKTKNAELPEIVLTRSEGTETLMPELSDNNASEPLLIEPEVQTLALPAPEAEQDENPEVCTDEDSENELAQLILLSQGEPEQAADEPEVKDELDEEKNEGGEESVQVGAAMELVAAPRNEDCDNEQEGVPGDYLMIIANGGLDIRDDDDEILHLPFSTEDTLDDAESDQEGEGNVILFRNNFPLISESLYHDAADDEKADEPSAQSMLRVLPMASESNSEREAEEIGETPAEASEVVEAGSEIPVSQEVAAASPVQPEESELSPEERLGLLRAVCGTPEIAGQEAAIVGDDSEHVILYLDDESVETPESAAAVREEMEREYQERMDEFARRFLELQAAIADGKAMVQEKQKQIDGASAKVTEYRDLLVQEVAKNEALERQLASEQTASEQKESELVKFSALKEEHELLYTEFEDLRKAYNEVVTDVMPTLQNERDELSLTVERQCGETDELRSSLGSTRRRLAAGYSLAAAACLMLVALPVANWLRSGDASKELAINHQEVSELRESVRQAEFRNVDAEKEIFDLRRQMEIAQVELSKLRGGSGGSSYLESMPYPSRNSQGLEQGVRSGNPTRTAEMSMNSHSPAGGGLRVNEVRDPGGRIEQAMNNNRDRRQQPGQDQLAQGNRNGADIPVSMVARTDSRNTGEANIVRLNPAPSGGIRPPSTSNQVNLAMRTSDSSASRSADARNEVKAKVQPGEGVAQVVYRVLGTRDPEVINWVIRENSIKKDRRGNPRIYPEQELRLPKEGRLMQSASAARR